MNAKQTSIVTLIVGITLLASSALNIIGFNNKYSALSAKSDAVPFQEGMSYTTWASMSFNTTAARHEFDEMKSIGVEWVAVNHWWFQDYLNSTEIKMGYWSDTFENMTACFQYARSIGLHVFYKPMLNLLLAYDWRSYILFTDTWMANYSWWMVENAKAAEEGGVEMLSIGCEMGNMQVHSDDVRHMIADIRAVYSGLLTYSANHDSYMHVDWYDAIDMIGISMYTMMTIDWNPTVLELTTVWDGIYHDMESIALRWNRPIAFTEIGIQARDGSNLIPNDNQISLQKDVAEMRNYYLSLFQSRIWTAPWFKGAYWWIWDGADPATNPNLDSFNPILIKDAIQAEYAKPHVVESPTIPLISTIVPLLSGCIILAAVTCTRGSLVLDKSFTFVTRRKKDLLHAPASAPGIEAPQGSLGPGTGQQLQQLQRGTILRNEIVLGLIVGCVFSSMATSMTIDVYGVVQKTISYAIILGLSTTETLATFATLLLLAILAGVVMLRYLPRHVLLACLFILLFYPYLSLGDLVESILVARFFDMLTLTLLLACVVVNVTNRETRNVLRVVLVAAIVAAGYFVSVLAFHALSPALLALPVGVAIIMGNKQERHEPQSSNVNEEFMIRNVESDNNKEKRIKSRVQMMLIMNALLAGMILPFGNSIINLVHMDFLSVTMHYLPCVIAAVVIGVIVLARSWGGGIEGRRDITKLFSNNMCLLVALIAGIAGIPFILAGRLMPIWAVISGWFFIQFTGTFIVNVKKGVTRDNLGGGFMYIMTSIIFFIIGFMINGIKGLFVYTLTFLVFKDGQIVRRDPAIDPVPPFDVPLVLDGIVLGVIIGLAVLLLVYKLISQACLKRWSLSTMKR